MSIPPVLVRLVREHVNGFGTAEDGRLFPVAQGRHLLSKECAEAWKAVRLAVWSQVTRVLRMETLAAPAVATALGTGMALLTPTAFAAGSPARSPAPLAAHPHRRARTHGRTGTAATALPARPALRRNPLR
ncbi:hypothetical protein [Streptomyces sp. NPDC058678]|uniref:hypothetical protein n=1 Tax=Streptomyces sp. NPDC058678 TaxID=3346595 RepID=UPI003656DF32